MYSSEESERLRQPLLQGGCFTFEHASTSKILTTSVMLNVSMESWRSCGSLRHVFSPKRYSFNSYASSVATCWTGKTLSDFTKASGELLVGFLLACKADRTKITGKQLSWH